jgi:hypothetical protein
VKEKLSPDVFIILNKMEDRNPVSIYEGNR